MPDYKDNPNYQLCTAQVEILAKKFKHSAGTGKDAAMYFGVFSEPATETKEGTAFKYLVTLHGDKFALAYNLKKAAFENQDLYEVLMLAALAIQEEAAKTIEAQQLQEARDIANDIIS